jgi:predicted peptidase
MSIFMPNSIPPEGVPIVIFNHGRPFKNVSTKGYYPKTKHSALITLLRKNGIASAFPIRSGYFSAGGVDREKVPCNSPTFDSLKSAGKSAAKNISSAVEFVKSLPNINKSRIFVGGTSAGGFGSICSIPMISEDVRGIFSLSGGRCGKRGKALNGLDHIQEIYKEIAKNSHIAVAFFGGTRDIVCPVYSTQRLYESFCEGRGIRCKESVYLVIVEGASHKSNSMVQRSGQRIVQFINQGDPNIE